MGKSFVDVSSLYSDVTSDGIDELGDDAVKSGMIFAPKITLKMSNAFIDVDMLVKKKGIMSRCCPDCGGPFCKNVNDLVCTECGRKIEIGEDGNTKPEYYGLVSVKDKDL